MKSEYLYIIREADTKHYKLGRSVNAKKRLKQLNSGNPRPLILVYSLKTSNAKSKEQALHTRYKEHRMDSDYEWFHFEEEEIPMVSAYIKEISNEA